MSWLRYQTFLIWTVLLIVLTSADWCNYDHCTISVYKTGGSSYDLDLENLDVTLTFNEYDFKPCGSISTWDTNWIDCVNYKACYSTWSAGTPIGDPSFVQCHMSGDNPVLDFGAVYTNSYGRSLRVTYICDDDYSWPKLELTGTPSPGPYQTRYEFTVKGGDFCPGGDDDDNDFDLDYELLVFAGVFFIFAFLFAVTRSFVFAIFEVVVVAGFLLLYDD